MRINKQQFKNQPTKHYYKIHRYEPLFPPDNPLVNLKLMFIIETGRMTGISNDETGPIIMHPAFTATHE